MKERWRQWLAETHGTHLELFRHFLARFFDSELVATPGEWLRVAAGLAAIVCCSWTLLARVLMFKYHLLRESGNTHRIAVETLNDRVTLMVLAMCLTTIFTALLWQSLFLSLRDYLALAGLPIRPGEIFLAKLAALFCVFTAFTLLLVGPTSVVFMAATGYFNFIDLFAACAFAFFLLLALQGLLLNCLPPLLFETASTWAQALFATAALASFPLLAWIAPALTAHGVLEALRWACPATIAIALALYLISYHRYRRLILEAPLTRARAHRDWIGRLLELITQDPREQAVMAFMLTTMARSRTHRLALLAYLGLGIAWCATSITEMLNDDPASNFNRFLAASGPLTIALFLLLGIKYLFALPVELRAHWMFRLVEREGRRAWLNAVERFVLGIVMPPVLLLGAIMVARAEGILTALGWLPLAFTFVAILFERLFRDWRKLPFTCSYLPGKRPLLYTLVAYLWIVPAMAPVSMIIYAAAANPASFLIILAIEAAIWWRFHRLRLTRWGLAALEFQEHELTELDSYDLSSGGSTVAQEEFQREWSDYLRYGVHVPIIRPLEENETRGGRALEWLRAIPQDLHYAARVLLKSPGFAITAILTLALGLGLNTALFTVFNTLVLKPAAVHDPGSLVALNFRTRDDQRAPGLTRGQYNELAPGVKAFSEVIAFTPYVTGLDGRAAKGSFVTGNYFESLGVRMSMGRSIGIHDREPVAVLDYRAWTNRYAADRNIIGRTIRLNGLAFTIIGVAAESYRGIELLGVDFWAPLDVWNTLPGVMNLGPAIIVGRLHPSASEYTARMAATAIVRRLTADREKPLQIRQIKMQSVTVPVPLAALQYFMPFLAALAITMAIPCFNTANMMLARAMVRQREIAVRLSLGASRGRIVRQMLTEGLLIAVLGGVAGLAVARGAIDLSLRMLYSTAPNAIFFFVRLPDLAIDINVFLYMLAVAAITTGAFALVPAARATKPESVPTRQTAKLRDALVIGQVALCAGLLISATIALRSSDQLAAAGVGYQPEGLYLMALENPATFPQVGATLATAPWAESHAYARHPIQNMPDLRINARTTPFNFVSENYFRTIRTPILRGRDFTRQEAESEAAVVIVSEAAAKVWWPGKDPLGQTVDLLPTAKTLLSWTPRFRQARVIGVHGNIVTRTLLDAGQATAHFPARRLEGLATMFPLVRGQGSASETVRHLEALLNQTRQAEFGARILHMQERVAWDTYPQRAASWVSSLAGVVALLLAITGMYGVMSYLVNQRTKEVGIRMAIGATRGQVANWVLSHSLRLMSAGLGLGVLFAIGAAKYFASSLGTVVNVWDLGAYGFGLGVVGVATMLAAAGPTRRATRVDPVTALRAD